MKNNYTVDSVVVSYRVLTALRKRPMGCTEIAREIGCTKNSAFRHCETLVGLGQLDRLPGDVYGVTPAESAPDAYRHALERAHAELERVLAVSPRQ